MRRYSLNIAVNSAHYARVTLPDTLTDERAIERANVIRDAMRAHFESRGSAGGSVKCTLTKWEESGRDMPLDGSL